jgi:3-isopropylmalate/(R)-2-methylmalate dehydratase small subunit
VHKVQRGDLLVAGRGFGVGKHNLGRLGAFKALGIEAFIAESFAAAWERDAINFGIPALIYKEIQANVETGDLLELDLSATEAKNLTRGITIKVKPTPDVIISVLEAGSLERYTLRRLGVSG